MEKSVNSRNYSLILKCLAIMLVMALMTNFTLSANAAAAQEKYVREVIIVTADNYDQAVDKAAEASKQTDDNRPYTVFKDPIYDSGTTKTYLCYATTNKASLAITSVKAMNMEGGWSYDEYNKYLDDLWSKAGMLVDDMMVAIREYNTNLAAKTPNAVYAKGILDLLYEDDSKQTVSKFFAEAGTKLFEDKYKTRLTSFLMESNTSILCSIENALLLACADSYKGAGNNLFDGMEQNTFLASLNGMKGYTQYDTAAADIINSLPEAQEAIAFYENSGHPYTAEMEEMALMQEDSVISEGQDEGKDDGEIFADREEAVEEMREMAADDENPLDLDDEQLEAAQALYAYEEYYNGLSPEDQTKYTTGRMLYAAFSECAYTGYKDENGDREYTSLLDLVMKYDLNDPMTPEENYKTSDFYPMIHLMSAGQRAMLKVGFTQFVSSVITDTELLEINQGATLAALNEKAEEGEEIKAGDTVSVYYGVDRSLFEKDSGIALTSKAIAESKEKPLGATNEKYKKMDQIATYAMIASGATSALMTTTTIGITLAMKMAFQNAVLTGAEGFTSSFAGVAYSYATNVIGGEVTQALVSDTTGEVLVMIADDSVRNFTGTFGQCLESFITAGGIGMILTVVNLVSIAALIISLVIKLVATLDATGADKPYIDIPRVMCSYQPVFSENGGDTEEDYIYYYGVKNPLLTQADQDRASAVKSDDGTGTNILKYGIGDIANWSLHGRCREWVALYASTDKKAGNPILADSFMVTADPLAIKDGLVAVQKFNFGDPYDMHTYYGISTGKTVEKKYIGYKMESKEASAASVFSEASPLGTLVVGVLAGGAIGTLITYFVARKRKNKVEAVEG